MRLYKEKELLFLDFKIIGALVLLILFMGVLYAIIKKSEIDKYRQQINKEVEIKVPTIKESN